VHQGIFWRDRAAENESSDLVNFPAKLIEPRLGRALRPLSLEICFENRLNSSAPPALIFRSIKEIIYGCPKQLMIFLDRVKNANAESRIGSLSIFLNANSFADTAPAYRRQAKNSAELWKHTRRF